MTQREALDLLERATIDLPLDLDGIVAGAVRRGRTRRRNHRTGTTVAVAAVVGLGAAVLPLGGGGGGELAVEPTVGPSQTTTPPPTPSPTPPPTPTVPAAREFGVSAEDFPAIVAGLAGITQVEGPLMNPPYGVVDDATGQWVAHFRLNGMLTSLVVYRVSDDQRLACEESFGTCREIDGGWLGSEAGEPQDGVRANHATAWVGNYEIAAVSYNAAEGKDSPVLSERPQLSRELLEQIVASDVWFTPTP